MTWHDEDPMVEIDYLLGLDLAQGGADYTALAVLEHREPWGGSPADYAAIWLERWRDKRTARIPERVATTCRRLVQRHRQREFARTGVGATDVPPIRLVVDQTGVGPFGLDPLREAGLDPLGIVIHGGDAVSRPDAHTYRVPKRDIAGAIDVLLESRRLRVEATLPDAVTLRAELENFRAKINLTTGHDSYEAWREGEHDDLVLAVGIAIWLGEAFPAPTLDPAIAAMWNG